MLPDGHRVGGAPLNVAVRLAQCGVDARLLSRVGCDTDGDALLDYLDRVGLSRQYVQRDEAHATGAVRVDTSNPQAPRYTIEPMAAWDFIDAEPYLRLAAQPIEVIVFGSLAARHAVARQALLTLLDRARLRVLDVNPRPPFDDAATLRLLLERADWVKVNARELRAIGAAGRAAASIEALARSVQAPCGLAALCVTPGEQALCCSAATISTGSGRMRCAWLTRSVAAMRFWPPGSRPCRRRSIPRPRSNGPRRWWRLAPAPRAFAVATLSGNLSRHSAGAKRRVRRKPRAEVFWLENHARGSVTASWPADALARTCGYGSAMMARSRSGCRFKPDADTTGRAYRGQSLGFRKTSYNSASGEPGSGCQSYSQWAAGGMDIRIDSVRPPDCRPNRVPRS